jgi:hypothetical protein
MLTSATETAAKEQSTGAYWLPALQHIHELSHIESEPEIGVPPFPLVGSREFSRHGARDPLRCHKTARSSVTRYWPLSTTRRKCGHPLARICTCFLLNSLRISFARIAAVDGIHALALPEKGGPIAVVAATIGAGLHLVRLMVPAVAIPVKRHWAHLANDRTYYLWGQGLHAPCAKSMIRTAVRY